MDWIEQWFGLNPDGGNGSVEALLLVALITLAVGAVLGLGGNRSRRIPSRRGPRTEKPIARGGGRPA